MKRKIIILLAIAAALCSCSNKASDDKYVDIDEAKQQIEDQRLDITSEGFEYDNKAYNIMNANQTIDDTYFYSFNYPNIKINLSSGRVQSVCNIVGCAHTENSPGCLGYLDFCSPVASNDGIYFVRENKVFLYKDGEESTVLENKYYTDYEKENYLDNKYVISAIVISNDTLFVVCPTYFFTYDIETGEASDYQSLSNSLCLSFAVNGNYIYHANQNMELFVYDTNTDSNEKIADKVGQVCSKYDKIYYIQYDDSTPNLYCADANGDNTQKIIEDCYVNYCVTENSIYYQSYSQKENVWRCNLDGSNKEKIEFNDIKEDYAAPYYSMVTNDSISHVFLVDSENRILFDFEDGSAEYTAVVFEE